MFGSLCAYGNLVLVMLKYLKVWMWLWTSGKDYWKLKIDEECALEIFDHLGHYYSKVYMWQPSVAFNDIIDRDKALD